MNNLLSSTFLPSRPAIMGRKGHGGRSKGPSHAPSARRATAGLPIKAKAAPSPSFPVLKRFAGVWDDHIRYVDASGADGAFLQGLTTIKTDEALQSAELLIDLTLPTGQTVHLEYEGKYQDSDGTGDAPPPIHFRRRNETTGELGEGPIELFMTEVAKEVSRPDKTPGRSWDTLVVRERHMPSGRVVLVETICLVNDGEKVTTAHEFPEGPPGEGNVQIWHSLRKSD